MVRNDEQLSIDSMEGFDDFADAGIHRFNGFDSRFKNTRMADHVGVSEVEHDHIVFIGLDLFDDFSVTIGAFISGCRS